MTLHIKFERNQVSVEQDIHFQKLPYFLHIFLHSQMHILLSNIATNILITASHLCDRNYEYSKQLT